MKRFAAALLAVLMLISGSCFAVTKDEIELPKGVVFGMTVEETRAAAGGASNARYYGGPGGGVNWELVTARAEACGRENPGFLSIVSSRYCGFSALTDCYFDTDGYFNSIEMKFKTPYNAGTEEQLNAYYEQYDDIEAVLTENFGDASEELIDVFPRIYAPYVRNLTYVPIRFTTRLVTLDDGSVLYIEHFVCEKLVDGSDSTSYEHKLGFTVIE